MKRYEYKMLCGSPAPPDGRTRWMIEMIALEEVGNDGWMVAHMSEDWTQCLIQREIEE